MRKNTSKTTLILLFICFSAIAFSQTGNIQPNIHVKMHGIIEGGYTIGTGDYAYNNANFSTSIGVCIENISYFGVGAGMNRYNGGDILLPLFLNVHYYILPNDRPIYPFLECKVGYSLNGSGDFEKVGLFANPCAGVSLNTGHGFNVFVSFGYSLQKINLDKYGVDDISMSGLSFNVGMYI